jgi:Cytochrome c oxidase subunit IV
MAAEDRPAQSGADPPGELIHLPGPSYQPVLLALGVTLAVVGVVINLFLVVIGLILTVVMLVGWIRDTRRDISELPLEHH